MTREWQEFFRQLFVRVGGYEGNTADGLTGFTTPSFPTPDRGLAPADLMFNSGVKLEIVRSVEPTPCSIKEVKFLEQFREPFKYYLPQVVWSQENFPPGKVETAGVSGLSPPIKVAYRGGVLLNFYDGAVNTTAGFVFPLPKSRRINTDLIPKLQWDIESNGLGAGVENVKWDFSYSWVNVGGSAPAATVDSETVDVQSFSAGLVRELEFSTIAGSGFDNESLLICSLTRDVGVANNYSSGAYYVNFAIGFEVDTVGGRTLTSK